MLTLTFVRSDMEDMKNSREATLDDALKVLLDCYFGWGGYVVSITENTLHVATPILGHTDNMHISGDKEEMEKIFGVVQLWLASLDEKGNGIEQALTSKLMQKATTPLLLSMVSGLAVGNSRMENFKDFINHI